jgi:surface antigen
MKLWLRRTLAWGVLIAAGLIAPSRWAVAGNCVLYARAETGVDLYGAAGGWWHEAAGQYERGHVPEIGSILVFKRSGFMPFGHVAVVSEVVGPGEILVDQSNWYHGMVTHNTPVIDTSADHDWTSVAVMNIGSGEFGRDSPTYGFVYPDTGSQDIVAAKATSDFDPSLADRAAYEPAAHPDLFHAAVADRHSHLRYHRPTAPRFATRDSKRRDHRISTGRTKGRANLRAAHRSLTRSFDAHPGHMAAATSQRSRSGATRAAAAHRLDERGRVSIRAAGAKAGRVGQGPA